MTTILFGVMTSVRLVLQSLLFCLLVMVGASAHAKWQGRAALGVVISNGNTNNSSVTGLMDLKRASGRWTHHFIADSHRATAENVETADRYLLGYKVDRSIDLHRYAWSSLRNESDQFSDIHFRRTFGFGFGHRFLLGPVHILNFEAGLGYQTTRYVSTKPDLEVVPVTLALAYKGQLNGQVRFSQRLSAEYAQASMLYSSTSDLSVKMTERWSLALVYSIRRSTKVAGALGRNTDSLITANLVYNF